MASAFWARVTPHVTQFARGAGIGVGGAALVAGNLALGVGAARHIDANGHPEPQEARDSSDVYAGTAALYVTRAALTSTLPIAARVGLSLPVATAAGGAAGWFHEKAGPSLKAFAGAVKTFF